LALLVVAVLDDAAINSAFAADPEAARATFGDVIERMLTGPPCRK